MRLPDTSKEYVGVDLDLATGVDLDDVTVEMAIVASGDDVDELDWQLVAADPDVADRVRLLIGPGTSFGVLAVGTYNVWTRVAAAVEIPVRKAGTLRIVDTV